MNTRGWGSLELILESVHHKYLFSQLCGWAVLNALLHIEACRIWSAHVCIILFGECGPAGEFSSHVDGKGTSWHRRTSWTTHVHFKSLLASHLLLSHCLKWDTRLSPKSKVRKMHPTFRARYAKSESTWRMKSCVQQLNLQQCEDTERQYYFCGSGLVTQSTHYKWPCLDYMDYWRQLFIWIDRCIHVCVLLTLLA